LVHIETVWGPIKPERLGITSLHEHVLLDIATYWLNRLSEDPRYPFEATRMRYLNEPETMNLLGKIKRTEIFCSDDLRLNDEQLAAEELLEFKKWGGSTIVDQTLPGIGRDPNGLRRVAVQTGLNVIASTGFYVRASHPGYIKTMSTDKISDIMVREITEGIDGTGIKAGVIGECGCTEPVPWHPEEKKVLTAACRAQKKTGVAFQFHPSLFDKKKREPVMPAEVYVDLIEKEGANPKKYLQAHFDVPCYMDGYAKLAERLLDRGINLSFDTWGMEVWQELFEYPGARTATDPERLELLVKLCKNGFDKQITLSHDVCQKILLKKYGGYGYSHVLEHIVPLLKDKGVSNKQINNMLIENPKRILSLS
jgi:phosphotriesterase-related protein